MHTSAPIIAFDVAPGTSGPGRYVASLLRGLEHSEFTATIVPGCEVPPDDGAPDKRQTPPEPRRRWMRLIPRFVRPWLGFRRQAGRLARAIRACGADLFHAQNTGCEEMPLAARLAGVPHVLGTFHVDSSVDIQRQRSGWEHRALEWYSNRSLHRAIAVSEAAKRDWVQRTSIPAERVVTIHNGIDPRRFCRR